MKRPTPIALLLLCAVPLLAGQTAPPGDAPQPSGRAQRAYANPSALIAADIALARLARAKGQWSALRELADDDASLFDPARTPARPALKDRADPPQAAQWEPRAAWISCDGSFGLTWGGWTAASGTPVTRIGRLTARGGLQLIHADGTAEPLQARGFDHFTD